MRKYSYIFGGLALVGLMLAQPRQAAAQSNEPPPSGYVVIDLAGNPITTDWNTATGYFTAGTTATDITMAIRNDPSYTGIDNIALYDVTADPLLTNDLLVNGNFSGGTYDSNGNTAAPVGWTYDNVYGAGAGGYVDNGACTASAPAPSGSAYVWCDGATQAYDAIDQIVTTNVGDNYEITFNYEAGGNADLYQQLSDNGHYGPGFDTAGNGNDVLVYAQAGLPVAGTVPEPVSMLLFGTGLAGLGLLSRRRSKRA